MLSAAKGTLAGGTYVGTLSNGGAVLSPYHDFASQGPGRAAGGAQQVEAGIENGSDPDADQEPGVRVWQHGTTDVAAVRRDAHRCHIGVLADGFHEGGPREDGGHGMRLLTRD